MNKTAASVGGLAVARTVALLITLASLVGCGQKGPLTLAKPADAASAPAQAPVR